MTSVILAQKLASEEISKEKFEKIKWLKFNNMSKKLKIVHSLKKIIDNQELSKTCRLCLKSGERKFADEHSDFDYVFNIKYVLGIEVSESDGKPQYICNDCEISLRDAASLKQTAEVTQWRLQQELEMVSSTASDCDMDDSASIHGGYFVKQAEKVVRKWACGKCRRNFDSQGEFRDHENLPSCRQLNCFICEMCGLELKTLARLKRHIMVHTGELRYSCVECPYRARTKYGLTVHERSHTGARPVSCPQCSATFPSVSNLASHRRTHLPPAYHCSHCQKSFRFNEALQNHVASQHNTTKPHVCSLCGKTFSTRKMVCRHERRMHNRPRMRAGVIPTYLRQQQELGT